DPGGDGFEMFLDHGSFTVVQPGPDEVAMILYTSGSTGRPKGVPLTHAGQLWAIAARQGLGSGLEGERFLAAAPLFHMDGLLSVKFAMAMHASLVLLPQFRASAYIEAIGRYRCTSLTSVPTMLALVVREQEVLTRTDLSSVKHVTMGSAPLTQALVEKV